VLEDSVSIDVVVLEMDESVVEVVMDEDVLDSMTLDVEVEDEVPVEEVLELSVVIVVLEES
jgi:hypothetical protein